MGAGTNAAGVVIAGGDGGLASALYFLFFALLAALLWLAGGRRPSVTPGDGNKIRDFACCMVIRITRHGKGDAGGQYKHALSNERIQSKPGSIWAGWTVLQHHQGRALAEEF